MPHSLYSTRRKRADSIAHSIGRAFRNWEGGYRNTLPASSPISLTPLMRRAYRARLSRKTRTDMEHYVRLAEDVISQRCDRAKPRARDLIGSHVRDTEAELVSRLMASAAEFGEALGDMLVWLESQPNRKAGILRDRRGVKDCPDDV